MYKLILSFRYMFGKRISYLAFLSVALCVFIVVVVMTVMRGLVRDFSNKNHNFVGDCVVGTESLVGFAYYEDFVRILDGQDFVAGASAVVRSYALVSPRERDIEVGLELMGLDPVRHSRATGFGGMLYHRRRDVSKAFAPVYDDNLPGCVLGIERVLPRNSEGGYNYEAAPIREEFSVSCFPLTARGALARGDLDIVNTRNFYYSDHAQSGLAREDFSLIYLPLESAQQLCGMGPDDKRASWIHIKFKPGVNLQTGCAKVSALWQEFRQQKAGEKLSNLLDDVRVQSWKEYRRAYIAGMEKEQTLMTVMFALLGVTTVFVVFVVFYMIVGHKSKDIGILKSIGASMADLVELYLGFAFLVGLAGSAVGLAGAWLFLRKINQIEDWLFARFGFQLWDRTIFFIGDIPSQMDWCLLTIIVLSAVAACLLGGLVPSWQAAKLRPVETLRVGQL